MYDSRGSQDCFVHRRPTRFNDLSGAGETRVFLANQTALPAPTICDIYNIRWQMEFLVKGIKHPLLDHLALWQTGEHIADANSGRGIDPPLYIAVSRSFGHNGNR
jgi:hypothetical protein